MGRRCSPYRPNLGQVVVEVVTLPRDAPLALQRAWIDVPVVDVEALSARAILKNAVGRRQLALDGLPRPGNVLEQI